MIPNPVNGKAHIFIIEHERIIGLDLQLWFIKRGYTVHMPLSLAELEGMIDIAKQNLIIINTDMHNKDDFESIKTNNGNYHIPIICLTSKASYKVISSTDFNIIGTYIKPFDSIDILTHVDNYFQNNTSHL